MAFEKEAHASGLAFPLLMAFIRWLLVMAATGAVLLAYRQAGYPAGLVVAGVWGTATITLVNFISLGLLVWRSRVEGFSLWGLLGFRRDSLVRDILFGMAWAMVLYLLLAAGVMIVALLSGGVEGLVTGRVFVGDADFNFPAPRWVMFLSALLFPLVNPWLEELHYRGYAQPRLIAGLGKWPGLLVTALGFGLQHMAFAFTPVMMLGYSFAFFLWGLGAGLIVHKQQRLAQVTVAHVISNLSTGVIPLIFMLGGY